MALNPNINDGNGMPVPFLNEMFVLIRDGVEFQVDKIPGGAIGGIKGKIYLSNVRMVFVADKPTQTFLAFDMPLYGIQTFENAGYLLVLKCGINVFSCANIIYNFMLLERINQPIFIVTIISGLVEPVVPDNENRALYSTHSFRFLFKEGGCGTFVPLFFNLIKSVRQYNQQFGEPRAADPLRAAETPVDEMMRCAYVDPNDPTRIFLQQPNSESGLRRRTYHPQPAQS
ncbi:hypothetical protein Tco_1281802 [Tanacetum coccineum]